VTNCVSVDDAIAVNTERVERLRCSRTGVVSALYFSGANGWVRGAYRSCSGSSPGKGARKGAP
jgi:hypothetical protein